MYLTLTGVLVYIAYGLQGGLTATGGKKGFIDQYFGGEYAVEMKCTEAEDEEVTKSTETFYQMSCFIEKGKYITRNSSY